MHLVIEAVGTTSRGGATVLNTLLTTCVGRQDIDRVTVFCEPSFQTFPRRKVRFEHVSCPSAGSKLRWAINGWQAALAGESPDAALSFNGFAHAPNQAVFIHNALLFDVARARLPFALRQRLRVIKQLTLRAAKQARPVCVQTQTMAEYLRPHGIQAEVFTPRRPPAFSGIQGLFPVDAQTRIAFVGSEVPHKDVQTLFGALGHLTDLAPRALLAGNFEPAPSPHNARWLGDVNAQTLGAVYRDADVLVNTSLCESLGLSLLEAMASGLPIVSADRPYAREICGDAAVYFPPGNALALAKAIRKVMHQETKTRCRERGFERHNALGSQAYTRMLDRILAQSAVK